MPTENFHRRIDFTRVATTQTSEPPSQTTFFIGAGSTAWVDSRTGEKNPGWRELVKRHESAGTNFSGDRFKVKGHYTGNAKVSFIRKPLSDAPYKRQIYSVSGHLMGALEIEILNPYNDPLRLSRVFNRALSEFYRKATDAYRQFDGGTFIGELSETLSMIKRPAQGIRKLINEYNSDFRRRARRLARGRPRSDPSYIKDIEKVMSDTWLQYALGMRPLMSDAREGAEALARLALEPHEYKKVQVTMEDFSTVSDDLSSYSRQLHPFIIYRYNRKWSVGCTVRIIGQVKCEVTSPWTMRAEVLGFTPENFVPTIYNCIPYSFLVDYFSNVGDVITAWSFPSKKLAWTNTTTRSTNIQTYLAYLEEPGVPFGGYDLESMNGPTLEVSCERTTIGRTYEGIGLPKVTFELPGSSIKWLNMGALAHMRFF